VDVTITFATSGGNAISPLVVSSRESVLSLPISKRLVYTFTGWYLDPCLTILFEGTTVPAFDLVLYAAWEEVTA